MVIVPGICGAFGGGVVVSAVESECEHSVSDERRASPMQREIVVVSTGLLLPRNEAGNGGGDGGGGDTLRTRTRAAGMASLTRTMASGSIESESQLECCEEDEPRKLPLQFGCDSGGGGGGGDSEEADDAIASRTIAQ